MRITSELTDSIVDPAKRRSARARISRAARERLETKSFYIVWRKSFMESPDLESTLKHLFHAIQEHMSPSQPFAFPSHRHLAHDCSLHRSTVGKHLAPKDPPAPVVLRGRNQEREAWLIIDRSDESKSTNTYFAAIPGIGMQSDLASDGEGVPPAEEDPLPF